MKKWVVCGLEKSGKTSICDFIENQKSQKTIKSDLSYREKTLEIPGAYIDNTWMNNIVIMLAQNQGKANIFLIDGNTLENKYPPQYARAFTKPSIAIVTKADLLDEEKRLQAKCITKEIGCDTSIFVSFESKEGLKELGEWLKKTN